jgi:MoaA/NifB/PqqE/SkfB family radical SAM enzyme
VSRDPRRRYVLNPAWTLAPEGGRAILHRLDLIKIVVRHPTPRAALLAAMFDGERTLEEVLLLWGMIFRIGGRDDALADCSRLLAELDAAGDVIVPVESVAGPIRHYDLKELVGLSPAAPWQRLARPIRCTIHPTNRCQTECVYCYAERPRTEELSLGEWCAIFDQLRALDIRVVDVSGGDPMARRDSVELCAELVRRGCLFFISTKCSITREDAGRLAAAGFAAPVHGIRRFVQISVDAADPALADRLTATTGYLERATASVDALLGAGIPVRVKATLTGLSHDQVEPLVEHFHARGVRDFGFANYFRSAFRHDDTFWLTEAQAAGAADACARARERHPDITLTGSSVRSARRPDAPAPKPSQCSAGRETFGILPDGRVVLCEQLSASAPFVVGDLRRQSIAEMWGSPALDPFVRPERELFRGTLCFTCPEFDGCKIRGNTCFKDAFKAFGTPFAPHPQCHRARNVRQLRIV